MIARAAEWEGEGAAKVMKRGGVKGPGWKRRGRGKHGRGRSMGDNGKRKVGYGGEEARRFGKRVENECGWARCGGEVREGEGPDVTDAAVTTDAQAPTRRALHSRAADGQC